jgi:hypothetical protein
MKNLEEHASELEERIEEPTLMDNGLYRIFKLSKANSDKIYCCIAQNASNRFMALWEKFLLIQIFSWQHIEILLTIHIVLK